MFRQGVKRTKQRRKKSAKSVYLSPFYFQKGFTMMCGFTVSEYIRTRRLALAGSELLAGNERIIDIALKYGYDSPDSFTKAFTRFHGVTPACARKDHAMLKSFAPLKVKISLEGGYLMDYRIEKKRRLPLSRTITPRAQAKTCRKASR